VYKKGSSARPGPMASKVKTDFPGVDPSVEGGKYFIGYSCKQVERLSAGPWCSDLHLRKLPRYYIFRK
jgi:hypothetical protein